MISYSHNPNFVAYPWGAAARTTTSALLGLPFDMAREVYAKSVKAGLIKDSLIDCARYSRDLRASEKLVLGSWARER